jgi:hypothetical protein
VKLYGKGNRVTQPTYGAGTVTSSDDKYTVIEFDLHGRRVFLTDMVTLGKTDEPAPHKPAKERRKKVAATDKPEAADKAAGKAAAPAKTSGKTSGKAAAAAR